MNRETQEQGDAFATSPDLVLQGRKLGKSFAGVRVLDNVNLNLVRGSVQAVMGENGAGKSTLMKILAGLLPPDEGEIRLHHQTIRLRNPHDALQRGILMIHQELMPFTELTVAENIFMGHEPSGRFPGWIDRRRMEREAQTLLDRLGAGLSARQDMRDLSVAQMQLVEITRALAHRTEVLIMDEPTSALSDREIAVLFGLIKDLQRQGVSIIYISHKLEEVFHLADTITVLRDGRHIASAPAAEMNRERLIQLMVGRAAASAEPALPRMRGHVVLEARNLSRRGKYHQVGLSVRQGEVVGLAGLMGAGRTEVIHALCGLEPPDHGEIWIHGRPANIRHPADAWRLGLGYVGEDRKVTGLVPGMSVLHNATLASLRSHGRGPMIRSRLEDQAMAHWITELGIKTAGHEQAVERLSGGNQQKVVLARALMTNPDILLLDEPTRGIDVGAKAAIHALIQRLAARGKAILLASSELPEVLALCDRVLVMQAGRLTAELAAREATPESIMHHAMAANHPNRATI